MSLYVGVDSGTQSVKAIALDLDTGQVVAEARAAHHLIDGLPPGHMEAHPEEWVSAMDAVIAEVASSIDGSRVRGIGVSGQQHGFVPLDEKGARPSAPEAPAPDEHGPGMRDPDPQTGRTRGRHPKDGSAVPARLHGPQGALA